MLGDEGKSRGETDGAGVFISPQEPDAGIRPLGFPRTSSRLPTQCVGLVPVLRSDNRGDGCRRPALEVKNQCVAR